MAAADQLGARAYTLGRDIHLGSEASRLTASEYQHLLTHEAIHTVQQGGRAVTPGERLSVSHPSDPAEHEAHELADLVGRMPSPSLAVRDQVLRRVRHNVRPHVQRDLKGAHTAIPNGTFKMDFTATRLAGAVTGLDGTIKFTASDRAPDSKNIRLLQVVRAEDLDTGKEHVWTGGEADRNEMMTSLDKDTGVEPGFFVDHRAAVASPYTGKGEAVSPYYREYWPFAHHSQDGSKLGKTITEASLGDFPRSSGKRRFTFETAAKAADTGYVYATLRWGFTCNDPSPGTVTKEHAVANPEPSATFDAALTEFNEFYRNPGTSSAPGG
jgi:hypothetical protein